MSNGGSVWDRGSSDDGDEPVGASQEPVDEPAESVDEPDAEEAAHVTVWSRGPSVDDALAAAAAVPTRSRPVPVLPPPAPAPRRVSMASQIRRPVAGLVAAAVAAATIALAWMLGVVGGDDPDSVAAGTTTVPSLSVTPPSVSTTSPVTSVAPTTTVSVASTTSPTTSTTTSTTSTTTSTTSTTTSTTSTTTTTVAVEPAGPVVEIVGRTGPCKFGDDCLIADFSIADFPTQPREFVCEFRSGGRYTFRFDSESVESACASSAVDAAITIEVDGVRSDTVTR